jgi:glutamate dehydrogenase
MVSGSVKVFAGYRVQYNDALGPTKGGIRYHPHVHLEEVQELAFLMTIKNAIAGLPYGGGKGGVTCDPKTMSEGELERLTRGYVRALGQTVGPLIDIPAPDVNTGPQTMDWFVQEYEAMVGHEARAVVTGKSVASGGSLGRDSATGRGGVFILAEYAREHGWNVKDKTVAIQGFGNVGGWFARLAAQEGFKVVAVSGSKGGVYNKEGFTLAELESSLGARVLPRGEEVSNEALLKLPVDVLVPAALSEQITKDNAARIQASLVIEMANAPTTPEGDALLYSRGVTVIPDVLANGGGVTVSYFEWRQNLTKETWSEEKVNEALEKSIVSAYREIRDEMEKRNTPMRSAAYSRAVTRILGAERIRGRV